MRAVPDPVFLDNSHQDSQTQLLQRNWDPNAPRRAPAQRDSGPIQASRLQTGTEKRERSRRPHEAKILETPPSTGLPAALTQQAAQERPSTASSPVGVRGTAPRPPRSRQDGAARGSSLVPGVGMGDSPPAPAPRPAARPGDGGGLTSCAGPVPSPRVRTAAARVPACYAQVPTRSAQVPAGSTGHAPTVARPIGAREAGGAGPGRGSWRAPGLLSAAGLGLGGTGAPV
nr:PREDICTED: translation initiation factor IF-2-like [Macaca fascicularis]